MTEPVNNNEKVTDSCGCVFRDLNLPCIDENCKICNQGSFTISMPYPKELQELDRKWLENIREVMSFPAPPSSNVYGFKNTLPLDEQLRNFLKAKK